MSIGIRATGAVRKPRAASHIEQPKRDELPSCSRSTARQGTNSPAWRDPIAQDKPSFCRDLLRARPMLSNMPPEPVSWIVLFRDE